MIDHEKELHLEEFYEDLGGLTDNQKDKLEQARALHEAWAAGPAEVGGTYVKVS